MDVVNWGVWYCYVFDWLFGGWGGCGDLVWINGF